VALEHLGTPQAPTFRLGVSVIVLSSDEPVRVLYGEQVVVPLVRELLALPGAEHPSVAGSTS
jgi:hypothetical protein